MVTSESSVVDIKILYLNYCSVRAMPGPRPGIVISSLEGYIAIPTQPIDYKTATSHQLIEIIMSNLNEISLGSFLC